MALATFAPWWWLQLLALPAIILLMLVVLYAPSQYTFGTGVVFGLFWLIPTTYWYYSFMSIGVAIGASSGWVALLANLFYVTKLRHRIGRLGTGLVFILLWCVLTYIRMRLPVTENWWIPHLGYSVWHNSGFLLIGKFGGEAAIEAVLLGVGLISATLIWCTKRRVPVATGVMAVAAALVIGANYVLQSRLSKPIHPVVAIQSLTRAGVDQPATDQDVSDLITMTNEARKQIMSKDTTTVIWPENYIPASSYSRIAQYATREKVRLVYHTTEPMGNGYYKKAVLLNERGQQILVNYKRHIAPDEKGVSRTSQNRIVTHDGNLTVYVCYDMHYPDIVERLRGSDTAFVPLDDATYGYLQRQFHAADITLRAAQANTAVVAAATNGPTMIVNSNGVVLQHLADDTRGWLVRN